MPDILAEIIAHKHHEVLAASTARPLAQVQKRAQEAAPPRDFWHALTARGTRIIAECKRRSPSRGVLRDPYDPVALALAYERGGAAAISVLTDAKFFGGALEDLSAVRSAVQIPVLRKDFIVSEYQIYEARAAGADTFLLISGPLTPSQIEHFLAVGRSLGMEPLIESHDAAEFKAALSTSGKIFGINNRDLKTFAVDLASSANLFALTAERQPAAVMVCESGIKNRSDIEQMQTAGYQVFLIGEALLTHNDPEGTVRTMLT